MSEPLKFRCRLKRGDLVIEREVEITDELKARRHDLPWDYLHVGSIRRRVADVLVDEVVWEEFEVDYEFVGEDKP